jgi:hypothetical protein
MGGSNDFGSEQSNMSKSMGVRQSQADTISLDLQAYELKYPTTSRPAL